jgi:predicted Rossmann fold flavoprotein
MTIQDVTIIGAGAAGCFASILLKEINPSLHVCLLEKTRQPLAKVKVSGGGRCNVTHHCFEIPFLTGQYPRGKEFLQSAFSRFQPQDMIQWLLEKGIELKVEADGRMFPITDRSQTIIDCFLSLIEKLGVLLCLESEVVGISKEGELFLLELKNGQKIRSKKVLFSTGGTQKSYSLLKDLGHEIIAPMPSLFTFEIAEPWIKNLSGSVAKTARISLEGFNMEIAGPVLVTHFGLSGPATLKLSAFAARWLFERDYRSLVLLNWVGMPESKVREDLFAQRKAFPGQKVTLRPLFALSKALWHALVLEVSESLKDKKWSEVSKQEINELTSKLTKTQLTLIGKSLNKEEFVTSGGVDLRELHPKTLESKKVPGLYFAGELLNVDGVTGGFNFQNAWTSAYLAAHAMALSD